MEDVLEIEAVKYILDYVHKLAEVSLCELDEQEKKQFDELLIAAGKSLETCSSKRVMIAIVSNIFTHFGAASLDTEVLGPRMRELQQEMMNGVKQKTNENSED